MKITRILHPEIIQGLRGDPDLIAHYKHCFSRINMENGSFGFWSDNESERKKYSDHLNHLAIAYKARNGIKTYHIGKDFLEAIKEVKTNIPIELMPEKFFGYIAFPEGVIFDKDGDEIVGCYAYIGTGKNTVARPERQDKNVMWMVYIIKEADGKLLPRSGYMLNVIEKETILKDLALNTVFSRFGTETTVTYNTGEPFFLTMFNLILYISSPDSDLLPLRPKRLLTNKEFKNQTDETNIENLCEIPVTLVSWGYEKPIEYSKESTWVNTHLRWQRYGQNNALAKLIWVAPHERKFSNTAIENEPKQD